ncbi:MAG: hypothetical protein AAF617_18285 [Bacteroidota bacterium]
MKSFYFILLTCFHVMCYSQNEKPSSKLNGNYHLLQAESGVSQKIFEYGEHKGTKLMLIAPCKQCVPASYIYQESDSKEIGVPVFYNKMGLFLIGYDHESFVMVMPNPSSPDDWSNVAFSNFYSKNKSKVGKMSTQKIKEYILKLSE